MYLHIIFLNLDVKFVAYSLFSVFFVVIEVLFWQEINFRYDKLSTILTVVDNFHFDKTEEMDVNENRFKGEMMNAKCEINWSQQRTLRTNRSFFSSFKLPSVAKPMTRNHLADSSPHVRGRGSCDHRGTYHLFFANRSLSCVYFTQKAGEQTTTSTLTD